MFELHKPEKRKISNGVNKKIYFLSLGCPRNLVDSEVMLGILEKEGFEIVNEPENCRLAVVNSCTFIDEATQETIDTIFNLCRLKEAAMLEKVIVSGCFVQRFGRKLMKELPEVDGFLGTNEIPKIDKVVRRVLGGERVFCCFEDKGFIYTNEFPRYLLTPNYTSYLKISEGCRQNCSYCIIPKLRGKYRSRPIEDIISEAEKLTHQGCREFNIVGQDTTYYGFDLYGKVSLGRLLKELVKIEGIEWIRLLYAYPASFNEDLIDIIACSPKICKYIDIPVQHISQKILRLMNRTTHKEDIINLIKTLRNSIKGLCLRTSLVVGFPGEEEKDFEELLRFIKWAKFERLGIFRYSKEEGTPAASYKGQILKSVKEKRFKEAFMLQRDIAKELNKEFLGRKLKVIIDEVNPIRNNSPKANAWSAAGISNGLKADFSLGRTEFDAPEVDGIVYIYEGRKLKPGSMVEVEIIDTLEYDLVGRVRNQFL